MFRTHTFALIALACPMCAVAATSLSPEQIAAESARANDLFERAFQERIDREPEFQTALGIKKDYDKWSDHSDAHEAENLSRAFAFLAELQRSVNVEALDAPTRLSCRLFEKLVERQARGFQFRFDDYVIDQTGGPLSDVADLLINQHRVDNISDARAYVTRLRGIGPLFDQVLVDLNGQVARGVVPPRWVFPKAEEVGRNVISGRPFDDSAQDNPLWTDAQKKIGAVRDVDDATRAALLADARAALLEIVKPAYERVLARWAGIAKTATDDDGVWKFPDGAAYYENQLANWTTTSLSAEQIHAVGLGEVARLQNEIRGIMKRVGFSGNLQAFFHFLRDDPKFYLPDSAEGREQYLARATAAVEEMKTRLDEFFLHEPRADLVVKATESYREKTAPKAFYMPPAPNGTRPGMYYVTLFDMREMPTYTLEAIAFHEGIPGHHMQIALAQDLAGVPRFRRFGGGYGAFTEGWGLYCELLAKEAGFYRDPYSDCGRLVMELWRAVRLVVDTGIHARRWTRQQAIDYFVANNPLSEAEAVREVERYIVGPGQATSYKIGMLKILELREMARRELGAQFDIRQFHDVVLRDGAIPLDVLEEHVRAWIARRGES